MLLRIKSGKAKKSLRHSPSRTREEIGRLHAPGLFLEARARAFPANILDRVENRGHRFGETLSDQDKDALIAFVATL